MKGLQEKVALVTGGSSGIGQAIAVRLGDEGVRVAVNYVGPPGGHPHDAGSDRPRVRDVREDSWPRPAALGIVVDADVSDEEAVGGCTTG